MTVALSAGALRRALTLALLVAAAFSLTPEVVAQNRTVTGTVTAAEDGSPLPGATIRVVGTSTGTTTARDGTYSVAVPATAAALRFSFVGYLPQEIAIGRDPRIDVALEADLAGLGETVVTATRQPVRRLEATQAIDVIGPKQFEVTRPEGISEAITGTPGVFTSSAQGRSRGSIFIRGFPDGSGNGLVYTGILLDGLPTSGTTARPPDFAFGYDLGVERIEVVRGGSATLFGRASAAGAVNVITRTGGTEHAGTARTTYYNPSFDGASALNLRLDANANGPISPTLRYNASAFYLNDSGYRDLGYSDRGGQLRANVDWLSPTDDSSVRVYGLATNMTIQNMIDIPYRLDNFKPADGWSIEDSYYGENLDEGEYTFTDRDGQQQTATRQGINQDGNFANGGQFGLRTIGDLGGGLTIANHARYQRFNTGTKFNLGVSTFYFDDPNSAIVSENGERVPINLRILIDGESEETDFQNEFRIGYALDAGASRHNVSLGAFGSFGNFNPNTYSLFYVADGRGQGGDVGNFSPLLNPATGAPIINPGTGAPIFVPSIAGGDIPTTGSASRVDSYQENVYAIFLGDEMEIGDDLSVNVGARYDWIDITIDGFYPERTSRPGAPPVPAADNEQVVGRNETSSDFSLSLGANYRLDQQNAIFGNVTRAFRGPDYSAFSAAQRGTANPASRFFIPGLDTRDANDERVLGNEVIYNAELGARTVRNEFGVDGAVFYTFIDNRLATVYEGAIAVQRPFGSNRILGGELGGSWTPRALSGLFARASLTLQDARFSEFEVPLVSADPDGELYGNEVRQATNLDGTPAVDADGDPVLVIDLGGNRLPRVPPVLANLIVNYDQPAFGINGLVSGLFGGYFDSTNIYENPDFLNVNLGGYGRLPVGGSAVRLGLLVKNVLNQTDAYRFLYVTDNDAALRQAQTTPTGVNDNGDPVLFTGIPQLPRRLLVTLQYEF